MSVDISEAVQKTSPDELRNNFARLNKDATFSMWQDILKSRRDQALTLVCTSVDQPEAALRAAAATLAAFETVLNIPQMLIGAAEQEAAIRQHEQEELENPNAAD